MLTIHHSNRHVCLHLSQWHGEVGLKLPTKLGSDLEGPGGAGAACQLYGQGILACLRQLEAGVGTAAEQVWEGPVGAQLAAAIPGALPLVLGHCHWDVQGSLDCFYGHMQQESLQQCLPPDSEDTWPCTQLHGQLLSISLEMDISSRLLKVNCEQ